MQKLGRSSWARTALAVLLLAGQARAVQITTVWNTAGNGNWGVLGNWTAGVPNNGANTYLAVINNGTSVVSLNAAYTVDGLSLGAGNRLSIQPGGQLSVAQAGNLFNNGTLELAAAFGNTARLVLPTAAAVTFAGNGVLSMSNDLNNTVSGMFNNGAGHTIRGSGTIIAYPNSSNAGLILANQSTPLLLQASTFANSGTLRADTGGTLRIFGATVNNSNFITANGGIVELMTTTVTGGDVTASGTGTVRLNNAFLDGARLTNSATGKIEVTGSSAFRNARLESGTLTVNNGQTLTLQSGTFTNNGLVTLNAAFGNQSILALSGTTPVTLAGVGTIRMGDNAGNLIQVATGQFTSLVNSATHTIAGAGTIGPMTLNNQGTIVGDQATALVIDAPSFINGGTVRSAGTGGITIRNSTISNNGTLIADSGTLRINNSTSTGGAVIANTGRTVELTNASLTNTNMNAIPPGGTSPATGRFRVMDGSSATLTGGRLYGGELYVGNGSTLNVNFSTVTIDGLLTLNSAFGNTSTLSTNLNVTLNGVGGLRMGNDANNRIIAGGNFTNSLAQGITGGGSITVNSGSFTNNTIIDANVTTPLTINAGANAFVNNGTLRAFMGGALLLNGSYNNTNGTIVASNGVVNLNNGAAVTGGNLTVLGTGRINLANTAVTNATMNHPSTGFTSVVAGTPSRFSNVTLASGKVQVENNGGLILEQGTFTNNGTVTLNAAYGNQSRLILRGPGAVTLAGSGVVEMGNDPNNRIVSDTATPASLINSQTHTIRGAGLIGIASSIDNRGQIIADKATELQINAPAVRNSGTIAATGTGGVRICCTVDNTGGTISAEGGPVWLNSATMTGGNVKAGAGRTVSLLGTTMNGVALNSGTTGLILVNAGAASSMNGGSLLGGELRVANGAALNLGAGSYLFNGNVTLNAASGNTSTVNFNGAANMFGTGGIRMGNDLNNRLNINANVTNSLTQGIAGAGSIVVSGVNTFTNNSLVEANLANPLNISGNVSNLKTFKATNNATMNVSGTVTNAYNAQTGVPVGQFIAENGGTINFNGASVFNAGITGLTGNVVLNGTRLVDNHLNLTLGRVAAGNPSQLDGNSFLTGTLQVDNGAKLQLSNTLNGGAVTLNAAFGNTSQLELTRGGTVNLKGATIRMGNDFNNLILSGAQTTNLALDAQSVIQGAGHISLGASTLTNNNLIVADQSTQLKVTALSLVNNGTLASRGAGGLEVTATVANNGLIYAESGPVRLVNSTVNGGWVAAAAGRVAESRNSTFNNVSFNQLPNGTATAGFIDVLTGASTFSGGRLMGGELRVSPGATLGISGSFTNNGTIKLNGAYGSGATGNLSGAVLGGTGQLVLSNELNNTLSGNFRNLAGHTITGGGSITGPGAVNQGLITAPSGHTLRISGGMTNSGTLAANVGGTLELNGPVSNTGGLIAASGTLRVGSTINGGAVEVLGSGQALFPGYSGAGVITLDGVTLTNSPAGTMRIESGSGAFLRVKDSTLAAGQFTVPSGRTLVVDGTFTNNGVIALNAQFGNRAALSPLNGETATLGGTGIVRMGNDANNFVGSALSGSLGSLVNLAGHTIAGSGTIGNLAVLDNRGFIIADQSTPLNISPVTFINSGQVISRTAAGLALGGTIANAAGLIYAESGPMTLTSATINGGRVAAAAGFAVTTQGTTFNNVAFNQLQNGQASSGLINMANGSNLVNGGSLQGGEMRVGSGANLLLRGGFTNNGLVSLKSGPFGGARGDFNGAAIGGTGSVLMEPGAQITGAFTNLAGHSIRGAGTLSGPDVINQGRIAVEGGNLSINGPLTNSGLIENRTANTLTISNSITNTGGQILADGGPVAITNGSILGGRVAAATGSTVASQNSTFIGVAFNQLQNGQATGGLINVPSGMTTINGGSLQGGELQVASGANLRLSGDFTNNAQMTFLHNSSGNLNGAVIGGTGSLALEGFATISGSFTNLAGHTIRGSGTINGAGIVNRGTILHDSLNDMTILGSIDNAGGRIINSFGALNIRSAINGGSLTGGLGYVFMNGLPDANGQMVASLDNVTITGKILTTASYGSNILFRNSTLDFGGTILLQNSSTLYLDGTFTNNGLIQVGDPDRTPWGVVNNRISTLPGGTLTLTGGGTLRLDERPNSYLGSFSPRGGLGTIINDAGHTIAGGGKIGPVALLDNRGLIAAGRTHFLEPPGSGPLLDIDVVEIKNSGRIEASGGELRITSTIDNSGGLIRADGATVSLVNSRVSGGRVAADAGKQVLSLDSAFNGVTFNQLPNGQATGGLINISSGTTTINGGSLNGGGLQVAAGATLRFIGGFTNNGSAVMAANAQVILAGGGTVEIGGTGVIQMDGPGSVIRGIGTVFHNGAGHTARGGGNIGAGETRIVNDGKIVANQPANQLTVAPDAGGLTNNGTLRAENGATLRILGLLTNLNGTTLAGGAYEVVGLNSKIVLDSADVRTNLASILLDGSGAAIADANGRNALRNLQTNGASGRLALRGAQRLDTLTSLSNFGLVDIGTGSTLAVGLGSGNYSNRSGATTIVNGSLLARQVTLETGSTLTGSGTVRAKVVNSGTIKPGNSPGRLTIDGDLELEEGSTLEMEIEGVLEGLYDQLFVTGGLTFNGTLMILLSQGYVPASGDSFSFFSASNFSGAFDQILFPQLPGLTGFSEWVAGKFVIGFRGEGAGGGGGTGAGEVPEAESWVMIALGLAAFLSLRRTIEKGN